MDMIQQDFKKNKGGIPLRLPTGKAVGRLFGSAAAFKVKRSRHFFRALGGYSLDAAIVEELGRRAVKMIEFRDSELRETFKISVPSFVAHARPTPDYGYGSKLVCHERFYQDDGGDDLLPGMIPMVPAPVVPTVGFSSRAGA